VTPRKYSLRDRLEPQRGQGRGTAEGLFFRFSGAEATEAEEVSLCRGVRSRSFYPRETLRWRTQPRGPHPTPLRPFHQPAGPPHPPALSRASSRLRGRVCVCFAQRCARCTQPAFYEFERLLKCLSGLSFLFLVKGTMQQRSFNILSSLFSLFSYLVLLLFFRQNVSVSERSARRYSRSAIIFIRIALTRDPYMSDMSDTAIPLSLLSILLLLLCSVLSWRPTWLLVARYVDGQGTLAR
jgi:hypothetical protein